MAVAKTSAVSLQRFQEVQQAHVQLYRIAQGVQDILLTVKTVFPLDFFPDTIAVDRTQVTVTHRRFFFVGEVTSIRMEDILNVTADVGPFFGSLRISSRYYSSNRPYRVRQLWRSDALRLQAIINGLVIATKEAVDIASVAPQELLEVAARVGGSGIEDAP